MSPKCNFSPDQISMPDGASRNLSGNYSCSEQGLPVQINASRPDEGWDGLSPQETSDLRVSHPAAFPDQLEQKCLYYSHDNIWESSSRSSKTSHRGFEGTVEYGSHLDALPSLQSGGTSAVMQSSVAETYSSDVGIREEWIRVSFENSEPLNGSQSLNLTSSEKLRNNLVEGNLQHASSLNSLPKVWPGEQNVSFGNDAHQSNIFPSTSGFSGREYNRTSWHHVHTHHDGGIQRAYDKVNQLDTHGSSIYPENMEALAALSGVSSYYHGESITAPSGNRIEQLHKDDTFNHQILSVQLNSKDSFSRETSIASFTKPRDSSPEPSDCGFSLGREDPQTQQSHSFSPSVVDTSSISVSRHVVDYIKHVDPLVPSHQEYSAVATPDNSAQKFTCSSGNVPVYQPSSGTVHHIGSPLGLENQNDDPYSASQLGALSSGWNSSEKDQGDQPAKASSTAYHQNFQQMDVYDTPCNEASMENGLKTQLKLTNFSQGSSLLSPTAAISAACKQLIPPDQIPYASFSEKHESFDIRRKEVEHEILSPPDTRNAEFAWAQATSRKSEEVIDEAGNSEVVLPITRAKRQLIYSTQLMQQVFPPAPMVIICSDASSNPDCVVYSEARLTFGDVCRLTGQFLPNTSETSSDKPKTLDVRKFADTAEGLNNKVKKIEGDLSRLNKTLSLAELKVKARELEKFSIINRFAKFYAKPNLNAVNPASPSGTSTLCKTKPQRYVTVVPMPKVLPEVVEGCLSL